MMRARSARLRRVVAARTHVVSCARSSAATANFVATAMPSVHHATTRMASELTRRDTRRLRDRELGFDRLEHRKLGLGDLAGEPEETARRCGNPVAGVEQLTLLCRALGCGQ